MRYKRIQLWFLSSSSILCIPPKAHIFDLITEKEKAAPDIWELAWCPSLGLVLLGADLALTARPDALLLDVHNFTEHQYQTAFPLPHANSRQLDITQRRPILYSSCDLAAAMVVLHSLSFIILQSLAQIADFPIISVPQHSLICSFT